MTESREKSVETFVLEHCWRDAEPGVELVEVRYVTSLRGGTPDWSVERCRVLVPANAQENGLHLRARAVELPCGLGGQPEFEWHFYHLVIQGGHQRTTAPISQTIVSREVAYRERDKRCGVVTMRWRAVGSELWNDTTLNVSDEAAMATAAGRPLAPGRGKGIFRGRIWGLPNTPVSYVFCVADLSPDALPQVRWVSNDAGGWQELL